MTVTIEQTIDLGAVYETHVGLLVRTAKEQFQICESEAQALAHEVFLSYFLKASEVIDPHAWLISAIYNASKHYLRTRARHVSLPPECAEIPDPRQSREALPDQLVAREAYCCVTARCQLALRLHYLEGYTLPEIASELRTTPKYAGRLVSRCLRQARNRYAAKEVS